MSFSGIDTIPTFVEREACCVLLREFLLSVILDAVRRPLQTL